MDNKEINWEERRFIASTQILSGMCSNYHNPIASSFRAEDAVKLADSLISILSGIPLNDLNNTLYHPQVSE